MRDGFSSFVSSETQARFWVRIIQRIFIVDKVLTCFWGFVLGSVGQRPSACMPAILAIHLLQPDTRRRFVQLCAWFFQNVRRQRRWPSPSRRHPTAATSRCITLWHGALPESGRWQVRLYTIEGSASKHILQHKTGSPKVITSCTLQATSKEQTQNSNVTKRVPNIC